MGRTLSVVLAALAVASAFLLPSGDPVLLGALQCHELLAEPLDPDDEEAGTLADWLLESCPRRTKDGQEELMLYGLNVSVRGAPDQPAVSVAMGHSAVWEARKSIARGLRSAAQAAGLDVAVDALHTLPGGATFLLVVGGGQLALDVTIDKSAEPKRTVAKDWSAPTNFSVLPPLFAIAMAILLRRPVLSLFLGVTIGTFLLRRQAGDGILTSAGGGVFDVFYTYFLNEFADKGRAQIIGFVVFMLAMVGVMTRSGGIAGLMEAVARRAKTVRGTQIATYLMGLVIFFDDYANTILVGSTMRPLTDRFRIAREKLAYIVDSTAAPVAGLSIFSTWIAFEVSTFNAQLPAAELAASDGYAVFVKTIPYSFYCVFTLIFVGLVTFTGRDLGPMLTAEQRARSGGGLLRPGAKPMVGEEATAMSPAEGVSHLAWRAVFPLIMFIGVTLLTIFYEGGLFALAGEKLLSAEAWTQVLYDGSGFWPLFLGGLCGFLAAAAGAVQAGIPGDILPASWKTLRSMWVGFAILYLAWMIGKVCLDLATGPYLTALAGDSIHPMLLPTILFVLAGVVAFATGSSWSTMSILLPIVVGLAYGSGFGAELAATEVESGQLLMVMSIAAVLSGAIFGDHCSPISDTTVMSSIASASDHIDHVRTQAPYALLTMGVSILVGTLPCACLGLTPLQAVLFCWPAGTAILLLVLFMRGKKVAAPSA